jgi:peptidoglycan/LPS O-acetylase OafA/YrhL
VSTLVQSWFPLHALAWNAPGWSLSAEAFFYLAFPFFAPRVLKCSVRTALVVVGVAWLVSLAPSFAYQWLDPDHLGRSASPSDEMFWLNALTFGPLLRLPEFVVGVALGRLYFDARVREAIRARAVPLSIGAVVVYVATCASSAPYVILHNGLLVPVVAVLVVSLATDRGPVARVLALPALVALGDASYAMYILHVPIEMYALKAFGRDAWVRSPALLAVYIGLVVVAALVCFRWFETPIRNDVLAMLRPKKVKAMEPVAAGMAR